MQFQQIPINMSIYKRVIDDDDDNDTREISSA